MIQSQKGDIIREAKKLTLWDVVLYMSDKWLHPEKQDT